MNIEKYSYYEFAVFKTSVPINLYCMENKWVYEIYTDDTDYNNWMRTNVLRESEEYYDTEKEARQAAIKHIDALESGETIE